MVQGNEKSQTERERHWVAVIEAARSYSKGVTQYCEDQGISRHSYYNWFARLRSKHPEWNVPASSKQRNLRNSAKKAPAVPAVEVEVRPARRTFSHQYKKKILREADAASAGEVAALLRREGLYSSHLANWRKERAENGLVARKRGPSANPLSAEVRKLKAENARLQKSLEQHKLMLELQKKIAEILNTPEQTENE